jgi:hypothetical protein
VDRELVKDWITALRSGEYEQGRGQLRSQLSLPYEEAEYAYCCLGVAADVAIKTGKLDAQWNDSLLDVPSEVTLSLVLPDGILPLFGLTGISQDTLVEMNDIEGASFTVIADYIETYYLNEGEAA